MGASISSCGCGANDSEAHSPSDRTDKRDRQIASATSQSGFCDRDPSGLDPTVDSTAIADVQVTPEQCSADGACPNRVTHVYGCDKPLADHEYRPGICSKSAHTEKNKTWDEVSPAMARARKVTVGEDGHER